MRRFLLGLTFALALAVFLAAMYPASLALRQAEARSGGRLATSQEEGSVWSGAARVVLATPGGTATLDRVEWTFKPLALFSARIGYEVVARVAGGEVRGEVARDYRGWQARFVRAQGDAAAFSALVPLAAAWKPEGRIEVTVPRMDFDGRELRGQAEVVWREASLALSTVKPLGTYRAEVTASGGPARIDVTTLAGSLRVTGRGELAPGGALSFAGEARAEGADAAQLESLLDALGPRRADGARTLELRTR